jgi:hypothetical protein
MIEPRYDQEKNESRHAAVDEGCCEEMERKYGWNLIRVEVTSDSILEVDCVFEGETEFPKSYYDTDQEED